MNQQGELLRLIRKIDETTDGLGEWHEATEYLEWVRKEVQRILNASRPRVVETIDQLASLPDGTAIHNANGTLGELSTVGGVRVAFWAGNECEDELIEPWTGLPATVLYLPEEKP